MAKALVVKFESFHNGIVERVREVSMKNLERLLFVLGTSNF